ncbi:MAG: hypothetical protein A2297_00245 [Elusimicrobia bacterium RIFOXYB2_FULL_48_7]|nr:MAG: hypothetical protein A2297_00245 [Elusimicrobia bacterium RIFOXYB2_FULL_48_7]
MNILILEGSKHWTGGAKRAFLLSRELKKHGHGVIVVCPPKALLGEKCAREGMAVYTFMPIGGMGLLSFLKILKIAKTHKPQVIDIHSSVFYRTGALAGKIAGAKVVFTRNVAFRKSFIKRKINRMMYALADNIITVSQQIRADLVNDFSLDPGKIEVILDGIDVNEFDVAPEETQKIKNEFSLGPGNALAAGVVTRMDKTKGHGFLLEGLPEVLAKYPLLKFIITGTGKLEKEIKNRARQLGLEKNVIFTGFRNDIPAILSAVDFTVMPSYNEGLGMCILESLASGRPVVGVRTGGVPEAIIDGHDGVLVEACTGTQMGLAALLAEGIIRIMGMDLHKLGENGRKIILEKFSAGVMAQKTLQVYGGPKI